jgi:hypothetical protein
LIEPATHAGEGFDFGGIDRMIAAGKSTTNEKLAAILETVSAVMRPGVP